MTSHFRKANPPVSKYLINIKGRIRRLANTIRATTVHWGRRPSGCNGPAMVFCPAGQTTLSCGLAGLITVYGQQQPQAIHDLNEITALAQRILAAPLVSRDSDAAAVEACCAKSDQPMQQLMQATRRLKRQDHFLTIFNDPFLQEQLKDLHERLEAFIAQESDALNHGMGHLPAEVVEIVDRRIESLKDIAWSLRTEITENIAKVRALLPSEQMKAGGDITKIYRNINTVLNSIDRLEVRGRDSAGISLLFLLESGEYANFKQSVDADHFAEEFTRETVWVSRSPTKWRPKSAVWETMCADCGNALRQTACCRC